MIWEPVLFTDWGRPSTAALARIADPRASQYWDKKRLVSHSLGEQDRGSIVWDYIAVYSPGAIWGEKPPRPLYEGGPVVRVMDAARAAITEALNSVQKTRTAHAAD